MINGSMNVYISIIIPVYNSESYLRKCVDSVLDQTYTDFEIILINDGSTDNSRIICEEYCLNYENISLINQKNMGVDKARNAGLLKSKGEYITFLDSDDFVEKEWLASYVSILLQHPLCDWLIQGVIIDYTTSQRIESLVQKHYEGIDVLNGFFDLETRHLSGFTHNKMYKRSIISSQNILFEYTLKEDLLFNIKYCLSAKYIYKIPVAHYHYVQRSHSLIHKRYPTRYMQPLVESLYREGKSLALYFRNEKYLRFINNRYLCDLTVLLASMYRLNGIEDRSERIAMLQKYREERKASPLVMLQFDSKIKWMFAQIALLPPSLADFTFLIITKILKSR